MGYGDDDERHEGYAVDEGRDSDAEGDEGDGSRHRDEERERYVDGERKGADGGQRKAAEGGRESGDAVWVYKEGLPRVKCVAESEVCCRGCIAEGEVCRDGVEGGENGDGAEG